MGNLLNVKLTYEGNVLMSTAHRTRKENLFAAQLALSLLTGFGHYYLFEFKDSLTGNTKFEDGGGTIEYFKSY